MAGRAVLLASLLAASTCVADAAQPIVGIVYSPSLDAACVAPRGGKVEQKWKSELASRIGEFKALWQAEGPELIKATEAVTGKSFPSRHFTARLTLCKIPSQSDFHGAIIINMRYALKSYTAQPVPMRYKVDTLFHELLHKFLEAHPVTNSALLRQHAAEPPRVRDHLHLLALEKAVLLRLHRTKELKNIVVIDSRLAGGYYKRTWNIVNATDTSGCHMCYDLPREVGSTHSASALVRP